MQPTTLTTIHGHHIGNGRMHTKQESEGGLVMTDMAEWMVLMIILAGGIAVFSFWLGYFFALTKLEKWYADGEVDYDNTRKSTTD